MVKYLRNWRFILLPILQLKNFRSSSCRYSSKQVLLKILAIFTGKQHLCCTVGFREDLFLISLFRNSHRTCFVKKGALKNFANFHRKHLCWIFLLIKLQAQACNFNKKRLQHRCFPVNISKFFKNSLFYRTPLVAASKT